MNCKMILGCLALAAGASAQAAGPVKIGFIATLSTPAGYIGEDERDAFNLAIQQGGGKLGGVPVELVIEDDGLKPANAKQAADRLLQSGVRLYTGVNFERAGGGGAGRGEVGRVLRQPEPRTVELRWREVRSQLLRRVLPERRLPHRRRRGGQRTGLQARGAARAELPGRARRHRRLQAHPTGEVAAEIYTKLDQSDFSVELARLRSLAPDAIYQFHPGGTGINFVKQYAAAGLNKTIPMLMPSFSMDARMIQATGDASLGAYTTGIWSMDFDNPQSKAFVEAFKAYGRAPTDYAMQAYDTAQLIGAGLKATGGDLSKAAEFPRRAAQARVRLAARQVQHERQPAPDPGPVPDARREGRRRQPVAAPGPQAGVR